MNNYINFPESPTQGEYEDLEEYINFLEYKKYETGLNKPAPVRKHCLPTYDDNGNIVGEED